MIVRPFIAGTVYDVGDFVRDPDDGRVYCVKSPAGGPEEDVQVIAGPLSPAQDTERFTFAPEATWPQP